MKQAKRPVRMPGQAVRAAWLAWAWAWATPAILTILPAQARAAEQRKSLIAVALDILGAAPETATLVITEDAPPPENEDQMGSFEALLARIGRNKTPKQQIVATKAEGAVSMLHNGEKVLLGKSAERLGGTSGHVDVLGIMKQLAPIVTPTVHASLQTIDENSFTAHQESVPSSLDITETGRVTNVNLSFPGRNVGVSHTGEHTGTTIYFSPESLRPVSGHRVHIFSKQRNFITRVNLELDPKTTDISSPRWKWKDTLFTRIGEDSSDELTLSRDRGLTLVNEPYPDPYGRTPPKRSTPIVPFDQIQNAGRDYLRNFIAGKRKLPAAEARLLEGMGELLAKLSIGTEFMATSDGRNRLSGVRHKHAVVVEGTAKDVAEAAEDASALTVHQLHDELARLLDLHDVDLSIHVQSPNRDHTWATKVSRTGEIDLQTNGDYFAFYKGSGKGAPELLRIDRPLRFTTPDGPDKISGYAVMSIDGQGKESWRYTLLTKKTDDRLGLEQMVVDENGVHRTVGNINGMYPRAGDYMPYFDGLHLKNWTTVATNRNDSKGREEIRKFRARKTGQKR